MKEPKEIKVNANVYNMRFDGKFERLPHTQIFEFQDFEDGFLDWEYDNMGYYQYFELKEGVVEIFDESSICLMTVKEGQDESAIFQRMKDTILKHLNEKRVYIEENMANTIKTITTLEQTYI